MKFLVPLFVMMSISLSAFAMESSAELCLSQADGMRSQRLIDQTVMDCVSGRREEVSVADCIETASYIDDVEIRDIALRICQRGLKAVPTKEECAKSARKMSAKVRTEAREFCKTR